MPREPIDLRYQVEHLSILDEDGKLDDEPLPEVPDDLALAIHRAMLLARRFDERTLGLQGQGRIGTFAPVSGQEASQIGAMAALREDDWFVPSFRETAAAIWRATPLPSILLCTAGYNEGGAVTEDAHDLPIATPVATQIPHVVGLANAARYRKTDEVAITVFGDGATSEGDFHEALNFAGVFATQRRRSWGWDGPSRGRWPWATRTTRRFPRACPCRCAWPSTTGSTTGRRRHASRTA
jgi:TPP-dependent pyruvate/acetoin dehydrogenase alpha subunit